MHDDGRPNRRIFLKLNGVAAAKTAWGTGLVALSGSAFGVVLATTAPEVVRAFAGCARRPTLAVHRRPSQSRPANFRR